MHVHEFSSCCLYGSFTGRTHFSAQKWDCLHSGLSSFLVLASSPTPQNSALCLALRGSWYLPLFISLCLCSGWFFGLQILCPLHPTTPLSNSHASSSPIQTSGPSFTSCLSLSYTSQANFYTILYVHLSPSTVILCMWRIGAYDLLLKYFISKSLHIKYRIAFPLTCTIHIKIHLQATVTRKEFAKSAEDFFTHSWSIMVSFLYTESYKLISPVAIRDVRIWKSKSNACLLTLTFVLQV